MDLRRNGFRLASNAKSPNATRLTDPSTAGSGSYRTASNREALSSMGSLTVASTPSSAALRGHSIGFGSREVSLRSPTQRSKTRGGTVTPMMVNDKLKSELEFPTSAASQKGGGHNLRSCSAASVELEIPSEFT